MAKELKVLTLENCNDLRRGPVFSEFTTLERLNISCSENLEKINASILSLTNLRVLVFSSCPRFRSLDCSAFSALENLNLSQCSKISRLDGLEQLDSLRYLDMSGCDSLQILLDLMKFRKLERFDVVGCKKIIEIRGLDRLESSEFFNMTGCESIERLQGLSNL